MYANKGPASAGPFRVLLAVLVIVAGGCRVGRHQAEEKGSIGGFPLDKAADPAPLTAADVGGGEATTTTGPAGGGGTTTTGRSTTTARGGAGGGGGSGTTATTAPLAPFHPVTSVADRTGDAGVTARPYGDFVSLRVEDNGTYARFIVEVAGAVPNPPPGEEEMGVGIDLFHGPGEPDFNLFAHGEVSTGWKAWLQAGDNVVDYPGTFQLGGNLVVFTLPWSSIGGRKAGTMSAFLDWSDSSPPVVAVTSNDRVPDKDATPYSP